MGFGPVGLHVRRKSRKLAAGANLVTLPIQTVYQIDSSPQCASTIYIPLRPCYPPELFQCSFPRAPAGSKMARVLQLLCCVVLALQSSAVTYGPSSYAPPGAFPTSLYQSYYNDPTATSAQPQPVISDPVLVRIYASFVKNTIL